MAVTACGDDDGGSQSDATDSAASGFTGDGASDGVDSSDGDDSGEPTAGDSNDDDDTAGEGELRGVVTFTLYPADPLVPASVGFAGAWRSAEDGVDAIDDFFAIYALQIAFPQPPTTADTVQQDGIPAPFEWGGPTQWLRAGNGMKLATGDTEALACLLYLGDPPKLELPDGSEVDNFPIYASTNSSLQPTGCAPSAGTWIADSDYDLVLYGGERFETNVLPGAVHTPPALQVTGPDIAELDVAIDREQDLEVTWSGQGNPDDRIVIRMWDASSRMFTVLATDDGAHTIAAADLGALEPGPGTMTVAREHLQELSFSEGLVKVVTRYEQWGYVELF